ncbi:cold shock domain-containing protein [Maribellus sp. YY47]|uniref:cold-shock protein n=1 Tax=Maribellus sp. YY47 TaxID=2929486 RepID=UPI002000B36C|nr:cold shock domain-containing protein [Maribellus sp. YY47]MCK3685309.1 cold shock domain-containing protein [Maribellus sp. YY47]
MGRSISYNKRELEKKREQKRKEKLKRKEERKANAGGSSLDDMIAYVDENGVITTEMPSDEKKEEIKVEDIAVSTPKKEEVEDVPLTGRVEHFKQDKGYGFIKDTASTEKYFFHISEAYPEIREGDMVTFELVKGTRGLNAANIQPV